jgi:thiamine-monophosphate kinase
VNVDALPRSAILAAQVAALQHECLVAGGDDYELLFTAPPAQREAVLAAGRAAGVAVTRCGTIEPQAGLRVVDATGQPLARCFRGYDHFA